MSDDPSDPSLGDDESADAAQLRAVYMAQLEQRVDSIQFPYFRDGE
jgi:hypothetical protein